MRQLFESIVERCMAEGLVGANGFAVDASLIAADANKQRSIPSSDWNPDETKDDACRAAREYLATLDDAAFERSFARDAEVHRAIGPRGTVDRRA